MKSTDVLKRIYFVNLKDLSERQVEGVISTGEDSLWKELVKLCKENEVAVYKAEHLTDTEWLEFKKGLQKDFLEKTNG